MPCRLVAASGGGESSIAAALEALYLTAALWVVLTCMLIVGGVGGSKPRWAAWLSGILVPASGVANIVAVDMCSHHMPWAVVFLLLVAPSAREPAPNCAGRLASPSSAGCCSRSSSRSTPRP